MSVELGCDSITIWLAELTGIFVYLIDSEESHDEITL